jgi:hypothetical protein
MGYNLKCDLAVIYGSCYHCLQNKDAMLMLTVLKVKGT